MNSLNELIGYWAVRAFGAFVRALPLGAALGFGKMIGTCAYYFSRRHRLIVYSNLKTAFASTKSPEQLKRIAKETFQNFGQNIIELFRMPLMTKEKFSELVNIEGRENIAEALKQGRGVIILAMHYGSWEIANMLGTMLEHPYKVMVKPQSKYSRLDELLNSYRQCGGSVVLERGMGTRDFLKSLKANEIVALVVDQGGRDGTLVPFFGREASMAVGAVKIGVKMNVPVCFAVIHRTAGAHHKLILNPPLQLINTGDADADIVTNLRNVASTMEKYITQNPAEYMWFYKIWKYSKDSVVTILTDGKAGHLRQSEAVAGYLQEALKERGVSVKLPILDIKYKSPFLAKVFAVGCVPADLFNHRGRIGLARLCLTPGSFEQVMSLNPDFIISCGSSTAPVNFLLSKEHDSKSIAILRPSVLSVKRFDLVLLPAHDTHKRRRWPGTVVITRVAPNLVREQYLQEHTAALLKRFSHLKTGDNFRIGVLLGGDTDDFILSEQRVRLLLHQIVEAAEEIRADILITTSRRTSPRVENFLARELKKHERCKFLVLANRENVPEAIGGILGLSDVVIVSGDSISMVSEAACSGKKLIVFPIEHQKGIPFELTKHGRFVDRLNSEGFILSSEVKNIKDSIYKLIKNKVQIRKMDDADAIKEGLRKVL